MQKPNIVNFFGNSDGLPAWHVKWSNILTQQSFVHSWLAGRLFELGANVKRLDRGWRSTPSIAVANGDGGIVWMLLKAGAKISAGISGLLAEAPLTFQQLCIAGQT